METSARKGDTLLLALGNPLMGDDGVALMAARSLRPRYREKIDICESPVAGFALLDLLASYRRALIIDAAQTGSVPPGTIREFTPEDFSPDETVSPHYAGLPEVLALGKKLDIALPGEVRILGMEIDETDRLHEGLGPVAAGALPEFLTKTSSILDGWLQDEIQPARNIAVS